MEKIDKAIEILQAFKEGKNVEFKLKEGNSNNWTPAWNLSEDEKLNFTRYDFRIAKQPTYRPYANAEEFLKASKEHGHYVKLDTGSYHFVDEFRKDSIHIRGYGFSTFTDLKQVFVWADTLEPCGILEE